MFQSSNLSSIEDIGRTTRKLGKENLLGLQAIGMMEVGTQTRSTGRECTLFFSFTKLIHENRYMWINGDKFEGEWTMGKQTGFGTNTWANQNVFEGTVKLSSFFSQSFDLLNKECGRMEKRGPGDTLRLPRVAILKHNALLRR